MNPTAQEPRPKERETTVSLLDAIAEDHDSRHGLIDVELQTRRWELHGRMAVAFSRSGKFDDAKSEYEAIAKIELGQGWQMSPAESMRHIYFVKGKPAVENEVYADRMFRAGWSWEIQWHGSDDHNSQGLTLWLSKNGEPLMEIVRDANGEPVNDSAGNIVKRQARVSFLLEQARAAGLLTKDGPWKNGYRGDMMYWKAVARVRRRYCPHILTGAVMIAEALELADLDVSKNEPPPPPSERGLAAVLKRKKVEVPASEAEPQAEAESQPQADKADVKPQTDEAPDWAKTKSEREADTKAPEPEAKKSEPEAKQPAPITKASFTTLSKLEAELGTDQFLEILQRGTFASLKHIKYEVDALAMISRLKDAQAK